MKISTVRNKISTTRQENKFNFWPKWRSICYLIKETLIYTFKFSFCTSPGTAADLSKAK